MCRICDVCLSVPGPPVVILFPEVRTTSVRLIWQPPAQPNGIILGKLVCFLFSFVGFFHFKNAIALLLRILLD